MYRKVLVPLDGSKLAECALDQVIVMAKEGFAGEVTLVNVVKIEAPYAELYGKHFDINAMRNAFLDSAKKYLDGVAARLAGEGVKVKTEILEADRPAPAITEYAQKNGMEMVVIATHGYTGLKKLMLGSITLSVLNQSRTPVLVIRPEACQS